MDDRSKTNLAGVHGDLVRVIIAAAGKFPGRFEVTEGLRSIGRQRELVAKGKSKTLASRHITGHAVDLVVYKDGQPTWKDPNDYVALSACVLQCARDLGVHVRWGGDFDGDGVPAFNDRDSKFFDGPHFELSKKEYP